MSEKTRTRLNSTRQNQHCDLDGATDSSISKDLSWNTHISQITNKVNQTLGFVKRNARTKNQSVKELAYKNLVKSDVQCTPARGCSNMYRKKERSQVEYAPYTKQNIENIEMVQRKAAQCVSNSYSSYDSVSEMLSNLG